jgi:ankyrin repeat protein
VSRDDVGKTPLHAAASGLKVDGTIETVDYLLKHGASAILNQRSEEGIESVSIL